MLTYTTDQTSSTLTTQVGSLSTDPSSPVNTITSPSNPSESTSAGATGSSQSPESRLVTQDQSGGQGLAPTVPTRSSSFLKSLDDTTSMPDPTATKPNSDSTQVPQGNVKTGSRSGSVASSTKKETAGTTGLLAQEKPDTEGKSRPKKRGGFLSFLNCCSAPENANTVEPGDQAVPAKKTKVLQQKPGRQPTPAVKTNTGAGESNPAETKEAAGEGIGGPEYSELKPAAKPKMITRSSKEKVPPEKVAQTGSAQPAVSQEPPAPVSNTNRDTPLPPLPPSSNPPNSETDTKGETQTPQVSAAQIGQPQLVEPEESVAVQGTTINDRTPQQETQDSDITMPDAPPIASTPEKANNATRELAQAQVALPPPPPRNSEDVSAHNSNPATSNEKQQWLLPPLQPQLRGRKCLVLDLDETLVHSSFKVSTSLKLAVYISNKYRFSTKPISQYLLRLKANIIMYMSSNAPASINS